MVPGRVLNQTGCPGCQGDEKDVGLHANPRGTRAAAGEGVPASAKLTSRSASEIASTGAGRGQLRRQEAGSRISPLPSTGHVHRPEDAAAAGAG